MRRSTLRRLSLVLVAAGLLAVMLTSTAMMAEKKLTKVLYMLPRGKEMLDDAHFVAAKKLGYFAEEGLDPVMQGTVGATDNTKMVATGMAQFAFPSPYIHIVSVQSGMPLVSVFCVDQFNIFGFAVRPDSPIKTVQDLKGKTIVLGSMGWTAITDPNLLRAGLKPSDVKYASAGEGRAQVVWEGKADAVLTWEKEYQLWAGQGLRFRIIKLKDIAEYQGNSIVVSQKYLKENRDKVVGFCRALAKGMLFCKLNPEAAAEMTLDANPKLIVNWKDAVEAVKALVYITNSEFTDAYGWGIHVPEYWENLQKDLLTCGQIKELRPVTEYITNELIAEINDFDPAEVEKDAKEYKVRQH